MTQSLDDILARDKPTEAKPQEQVTTNKEPEQETPEATPAATATEEPAQKTETDAQGGTKMVPHEALHAEKQKVKRYTEQIASFEQTMRQRDEAWDRRFSQLLEKLGPKPEQEPPVDWFADPQAALKQNLGQALHPMEQKFQNLEYRLVRMSAESRYGADKVREFETYVEDAHKRGDPEIKALAVEMRSSDDPIGVGLKWYEKKTFDPDAERERLKKEILAEMGSQQTQQPPTVMPSNLASARNVGTRAGPAWSGPPQLSDIFKR